MPCLPFHATRTSRLSSHSTRTHIYRTKESAKQIEGNDRVAHWKEWLGSLAWKQVERSQTFITWMPTERPDVLDGENKELMQKNIICAWFSMLLASPLSMFGDNQCMAMTGEGTLIGDRVQPDDIRQVSTYHALVRPLYDRSMGYIMSHSRRLEQDWLNDWKARYNTMLAQSSSQQVFPAFNDFLESFQDARLARNVTTSIARFVEASETMIALPRGEGKDLYAERTSLLMKNRLAGDPWLSWTDSELKENLRRCYAIRISRNHGKGMSADLPDILQLPLSDEDQVEEALAKIQYVAELTAKSLASHVLLEQPARYSLLQDRRKLEAAWAAGNFL